MEMNVNHHTWRRCTSLSLFLSLLLPAPRRDAFWSKEHFWSNPAAVRWLFRGLLLSPYYAVEMGIETILAEFCFCFLFSKCLSLVPLFCSCPSSSSSSSSSRHLDHSFSFFLAGRRLSFLPLVDGETCEPITCVILCLSVCLLASLL